MNVFFNNNVILYNWKKCETIFTCLVTSNKAKTTISVVKKLKNLSKCRWFKLYFKNSEKLILHQRIKSKRFQPTTKLRRSKPI